MKATSCIFSSAPWMDERLALCRFFLVCVAFLLAGRCTLPAQTAQKYALLIGIGQYPKEGGWATINSPNDLVVISEALKKRGFPDDHIFIIKNEAATRAGILNAWETMLVPKVKRGDVVYFQFSGHGQQVADDNGDELDGYDEAIVPYDSPLRYVEGVYQGENLIRDDQLNLLFTALRQRLGPSGNLMVVLDACHSGTGTRGMEPARGTDRVMASDSYIQKATKGQDSQQLSVVIDTAELAPMAAFFGSAHNQLNFETRDEQGQLLGSLSYALAQQLSQVSPNTSYRGLFEQIRVEMSAIAPRQQPQAEGLLDQELLGGRLLERPTYFKVIRWNDPGSVVVDAGWVQGLNKGAVLGFYPAETRDTSKTPPLVKGTVQQVLPFEATLLLDQDLLQDTALQTWVYVLEQNFGDLQIGLSFQLPEGHPMRETILQKLARYPMIRIDGAAPEVFLLPAGNGAQLIGRSDLLLEDLKSTLSAPAAAERILRRILGYAQAKYLRQMEAQSPSLNLEFELIPVEVDPSTLREKGEIDPSSKRDTLGNLHFQDGDYFKLRVVNRGKKAANFTLLDIQPDNQINILIPDENETSAEFRIGPGQTQVVPKLFQIGPPAGVEMFKLLATEQAVDLRPIVQSRGVGTRSNTPKSPLEQLFGQTFFNDDVISRGGKTVNLAAGSLQVHSFTFIID